MRRRYLQQTDKIGVNIVSFLGGKFNCQFKSRKEALEYILASDSLCRFTITSNGVLGFGSLEFKKVKKHI